MCIMSNICMIMQTSWKWGHWCCTKWNCSLFSCWCQLFRRKTENQRCLHADNALDSRKFNTMLLSCVTQHLSGGPRNCNIHAFSKEIPRTIKTSYSLRYFKGQRWVRKEQLASWATRIFLLDSWINPELTPELRGLH